MSTIMPKEESLRKAVKWISAQLDEDPQLPLMKLVDDTALRFDLSPKDSRFLINFYQEGQNNKDA